MNPQAQHEMMKLVVSWTLIGAIIVTLIVIVLSLVEFLSFADPKYRNRLIYILAAEMMIAGIFLVLGLFQPFSDAAINKIEMPLHEAARNLEQENRTALAEQDRLNHDLGETKRQLADSTEKAAAYEQQIAKANINAEAQREAIAHLQDLVQHPAPAAQPAVVNTDEVDALKAQIAKAELELAESRQVQETLNMRLKETKSKSTEVDQFKREKERQMQRAKAIGRVLAINPGWNFVVLSLGDKQGVTPDSTMLVLRGGAQIAKLRVKTIEPTQSIADVIKSTVKKGVTVQPGDNVVFEEVQDQPAKASQSSGAQAGGPIESALPPLPPLPALTH